MAGVLWMIREYYHDSEQVFYSKAVLGRFTGDEQAALLIGVCEREETMRNKYVIVFAVCLIGVIALAWYQSLPRSHDVLGRIRRDQERQPYSDSIHIQQWSCNYRADNVAEFRRQDRGLQLFQMHPLDARLHRRWLPFHGAERY